MNHRVFEDTHGPLMHVNTDKKSSIDFLCSRKVLGGIGLHLIPGFLLIRLFCFRITSYSHLWGPCLFLLKLQGGLKTCFEWAIFEHTGLRTRQRRRISKGVCQLLGFEKNTAFQAALMIFPGPYSARTSKAELIIFSAPTCSFFWIPWWVIVYIFCLFVFFLEGKCFS